MVALALGLLAVVSFAGCGGAKHDGPPDISYGRDVCDECHMIISDARFAAAYRLPDGTARKFDDIGDMASYLERTNELTKAKKIWVHDYDTKRWLEAPRASFVIGAASATPMASGLAAFASKGRAARYAAREDESVLSWKDLIARAKAGTLGGQPGSDAVPGTGREES